MRYDIDEAPNGVMDYLFIKLMEYGKAEDVIYHPREDYTKMLLAAVPVLGGETA